MSPAVLVLAAACVTWTPHSDTPGAGARTVPDVPMQKWGIESCGAGSLSTVLQHYGDSRSMAEWDQALPRVRGGVLSIDMLIAARQRGFRAELRAADRAAVAKSVRQSRPVILMLRVIDAPGSRVDFFHYVVADGIDDGKRLVRLQFGDGRGRWTTFERIEKAWSGGGHAALFIAPKGDGATDSVSEEQMLREAVLLEDSGHPEEAVAAYHQLLDHYPSPLGWTNLGNAEAKLDHDDQATAAFRHALSLDPLYRDALNNFAWFLLRKNRLDEAELLARAAVNVPGPDAWIVADTLARIQVARGHCAEAIETFTAALRDVPASRPPARAGLEAGLGGAQIQCGRPAEARATLTAALAHSPDAETERAIRRMLAGL
jgi:Flp pilus assembly protein TadD